MFKGDYSFLVVVKVLKRKYFVLSDIRKVLRNGFSFHKQMPTSILM